MTNRFDIPILARPAFFDGQRLTAADLTDVQTYHRELRQLHNRALHNWGVISGYMVTGNRGQRAVQIQPGYALDCQGRDLILSEALSLPIPPVSGASDGSPATYFLTATYAEDEDLTPEMRAGTCGTSGAVRRPETALIRWHDPDEGFIHGINVVLAAIKVQNCALVEDVSSAERRDAIPAKQPFVAAGQTNIGDTDWELWTYEGPEGELVPVGVRTTVVTSQAGFQTLPRYQAHVIGRRVFQLEVDEGAFQEAVVDGYAQVAQPTPSSFELRVLLPRGTMVGGTGRATQLNPDPALTPAFLNRIRSNELPDGLGWYVVWMGIEG